MAKILLIEDTPECRLVAVSALAHNGHEVIEAIDGSEGLEAMAKNPQIVFVDYHMPVMNGYEFTREIRTNPKYSSQKDVTIIGIGNFPSYKRELLTDRRCLEKPWNLKELREVVKKYSQGQ